jgi:hypothetical protein
MRYWYRRRNWRRRRNRNQRRRRNRNLYEEELEDDRPPEKQ